MNKHLLGISGVCILAIAFALVAQHMWDMQPCPWCIIQRMLYMLLAILTLVFGLFAGRRSTMGRISASPAWRMGKWSALVISLIGVGVAAYQSLVAASQVSCNLTAAHKLISAIGLDEIAPEVFKVRATCADAAGATLLGVPFEVASGLLFGLIAIWALVLLLRQR
jgi:protein dithiol:quinone oxidoreductase